MRLDTTLPVLLLAVAFACDNADATVAGATVVDWRLEPNVHTETPPATLVGPLGDPTATEIEIVYSPGKAKLVERTGGVVELRLRIEHGPVTLSAGAGYSPSVLVPQHVTIVADEPAGWTITGACQPPNGLPVTASQGHSETPVTVSCTVHFDLGWNNRMLPLTVDGNGDITTHPIGDDRAEFAVVR